MLTPPSTAHDAFRELDSIKETLANHAVYTATDSVLKLRCFMEHHVICVLDFMSVAKSLQRDLTSVEPVWLPSSDAEITRFMNEIILDEESDTEFAKYAAEAGIEAAGPLSHFEWYVAAMEEVGADTGPILDVVGQLRAGVAPDVAIGRSALPSAAAEFGMTTFRLLDEPAHARCALFFHGREDVIPRMFQPLVAGLQASGTPCGLLLGYLERHIEADGEHHGPMAARMVERLFGSSASRIADGLRVGREALAARTKLWDAVVVAFSRVGASAELAS